MRPVVVLLCALSLQGCAVAWGCLAGAGTGVLLAASSASSAGLKADDTRSAVGGGFLLGAACGCVGAAVARAVGSKPAPPPPPVAQEPQPDPAHVAPSTATH